MRPVLLLHRYKSGIALVKAVQNLLGKAKISVKRVRRKPGKYLCFTRVYQHYFTSLIEQLTQHISELENKGNNERRREMRMNRFACKGYKHQRGKKNNFMLDQEVKTRVPWDRGGSCLNWALQVSYDQPTSLFLSVGSDTKRYFVLQRSHRHG